MASQVAPRPTLKAARLIEANKRSGLVYQSYDEGADLTTFRLASGESFILTAADTRSIDVTLRWRHLERPPANDARPEIDRERLALDADDLA